MPSQRVNLARMGLRILTVGIVALLAASVGSAAAPILDERIAVYRQFREAFEAGNFVQALPLATQVIELTRNQFGPEAQELVNPLTNLGTTYHRMKRDDLAADTYREALKILDLDGNATNERLLRPLQGLGIALRALDRHEDAIAPLKRAVDITRNREGLFATAQLPLLHDLVSSYTAARHIEDAGRELQYAYTIAETAYGKNDVRLLPELDKYGRWNESVGRYTAARMLHSRAVQIADSAQGSSPLLAIDGMRGLARSFRLAFVMGENEETIAETLPRSFTENSTLVPVTGPSAEGERALRIAVQRLIAATPTDSNRLGEVQADLGDWYMTAGAQSRAIPAYKDAWNSFKLAGNENALVIPVPLTYRPPSIAVARGVEDPEQFDEQTVQLRLVITRLGEVRDAVVINPLPRREAAERAVISALKRSRFRPGISGGDSVDSTDVVYSERVYVRKPKPSA
jgi:tetratricopeptide (TPR) repeat protein